MGRPPRPLPEGIGEWSDEAVAALAEERGERLTSEAIRSLRRRRGIPPAPPTVRQRNGSDRSRDADE